MKSIIIIASLFVAFLFIRATVVKSKPVVDEGKGIIFFEGSWQEVLALAKKENKLIFLDAYASWCGPCKMMKHKVFPSSEVGEYFNQNFINVKMDMEKGEGPDLAIKYEVTAYPSLYFIDYTGKVKKYSVGYHNAKQLIGLGQLASK